MAETTGIEWSDRTYNPWIGCSKVSPGCQHCYAETLALQKKWVTQWGKDGERVATKTANDPVHWNLEAQEYGIRYTVFCASLADVFEDHPDLVLLRRDLWHLIRRTPFLNWMLLTKRAGNIAKMLPEDWGDGYANVCLMVSVESQQYFDERVPVLRNIPARYRALSVEPLVGAVQMPKGSLKGIDLVILGGESGEGARPMNPFWVHEVRDACAREKTKFFFKQWGNWGPDKAHADSDLSNGIVFTGRDAKPTLLSQLKTVPERKSALGVAGAKALFQVKRKQSAGAKLDGKEYREHIFSVNAPRKTAAVAPQKLTAKERLEFERLEGIVDEGLKSFWKAGDALREIRDGGFYRSTHPTFEEYCRDKWEISRAEAYRQIGAADVMRDIAEAEPEVIPANLSQTRPLLSLRSPSERRNVWNLALKNTQAKGVPITAEVVKAEVSKLKTSAWKKAQTAAKDRVLPPVTPAAASAMDVNKAKAVLGELKVALGPKAPVKIKNAIRKIETLIAGLSG